MKRNQLERLLPGVFQDTLRERTPLAAVLDAMEMLHDPSELVLSRLDSFFDPRRAPEEFVPFLARWVDLGVLLDALSERRRSAAPFPSGVGRLRELTATAASLYKWRGTRQGLRMFLETATGIEGFVVDDQVVHNGWPKPFHIRVVAPAAAAPYKAMIQSIMELEKPAYVTYELVFSDK